jgi:CRISPR-associated protein Csm1
MGLEAVIACLDTLYERYFWCVPASTIDEIPDCSLYAHSRTAAAIAGALYIYHRDTGSLQEEAVRDRSESKFLLIAGDLSGIQKYIFAIARAGGGKVAKRLRARSFYIGRITQILAQQIISDAGLPFINIILSAGGKFHLLLPNTDTARQVLTKRETACQRWLRDAFQGHLVLNLAWVEMTGSDFMNKRVGDKFEDLKDALALKKHQPLRSHLTQEGGWIEEKFVMPEAVIQAEDPTGYYEMPSPIDEIDEEDLGTRLPRAECMAIYDDRSKGKYEVLGWSFSVAERASLLPEGAHNLVSFERGIETSYRDNAVPVHYEYRASHVPTYRPGQNEDLDRYVQAHSKDPEERIDPGQILPFNAIAVTSRGRKSIAYLKADVDNLGLLLHSGLEWHPVGWTFSKVAAFSRSLEFFFSGRVEHLLQDQFPMIYMVYSGGDDLLLVGAWDTVHDFARTLRREWKAYTAGNPRLNVSVGIALARPMTPVWAAAEAADTALTKKAKSGPKNQLCSFGHVMKWEEVDAVFEDVVRVAKWLENKDISSSFARSLMLYSELAKMYREEGKVEGLRYLPLLSYNLSRNIKVDEIRQWAEPLKDVRGDPIRHLGFVATYSMNLNRA